MRKIQIIRALSHYLQVPVDLNIIRNEKVHHRMSIRSSFLALFIKISKLRHIVGSKFSAKILYKKIARSPNSTLAMNTSTYGKAIRYAKGKISSLGFLSAKANAMSYRLTKIKHTLSIYPSPTTVIYYTFMKLVDLDDKTLSKMDNSLLFNVDYKEKH